ncbi:PREDICTED: uncharacterized protein LOC109147326 [Ipomoea nil]|uniref:uncharacterized protein LOC109147326 n=1 Tax=Ipomoea nil TaxID=35883 RepID=UPI000901F0B3|nr:PREDICTED: uncharacterized protein LOC109147326 [Ipomoea nil]
MPHYLENAKVVSLMDVNQECWEEDIIKDIFVHEDIDNILSILLPLNKFWGETLKWTAIWNLSIPPKIKTFVWQTCSNCLPSVVNLRSRRVECQVDCKFCNSHPETVDHLFTAFVTVCWKLWEAMNKLVWHNQRSQSSSIVEEAAVFLHAWKNIHYNHDKPAANTGTQRWIKPPHGKFKLNVDAANDLGNKRTGFGCILKDEEGNFVAAFSNDVIVRTTPKQRRQSQLEKLSNGSSL